MSDMLPLFMVWRFSYARIKLAKNAATVNPKTNQVNELKLLLLLCIFLRAHKGQELTEETEVLNIRGLEVQQAWRVDKIGCPFCA